MRLICVKIYQPIAQYEPRRRTVNILVGQLGLDLETKVLPST